MQEGAAQVPMVAWLVAAGRVRCRGRGAPKMSCEGTFWDGDVVAMHNMASVVRPSCRRVGQRSEDLGPDSPLFKSRFAFSAARKALSDGNTFCAEAGSQPHRPLSPSLLPIIIHAAPRPHRTPLARRIRASHHPGDTPRPLPLRRPPLPSRSSSAPLLRSCPAPAHPARSCLPPAPPDPAPARVRSRAPLAFVAATWQALTACVRAIEVRLVGLQA
ncbi:hypothetical protein HYPSUDRAFT_45218 [Hypholoma sublateritium FD-334 SS-4]|uniref:Uncharacterized protein n=1 Tax=Hypholoma sublateritium (strain FD-334 SS-4) TaxID=945553 RepID=A0A0D2NHT2_HYPSF|nr:hypothetical protein HYPSUDRAFT_45218 [Hypholoma sublateritium FD-334 SS-4]